MKILLSIMILLLCGSVYLNWQMNKKFVTLSNSVASLQLSIADPYSVNVLKAKDALTLAEDALKQGNLNATAEYIQIAKDEFRPSSKVKIKKEDKDFLEDIKSILKSSPEGLRPSSIQNFNQPETPLPNNTQIPPSIP